jgi:hypothetical protein
MAQIMLIIRFSLFLSILIHELCMVFVKDCEYKI